MSSVRLPRNCLLSDTPLSVVSSETLLTLLPSTFIESISLQILLRDSASLLACSGHAVVFNDLFGWRKSLKKNNGYLKQSFSSIQLRLSNEVVYDTAKRSLCMDFKGAVCVFDFLYLFINLHTHLLTPWQPLLTTSHLLSISNASLTYL
jgi:hypothetical protein